MSKLHQISWANPRLDFTVGSCVKIADCSRFGGQDVAAFMAEDGMGDYLPNVDAYILLRMD